ncbi:tetratricopeptide repeat protein [soil metagenome]
MRDAINTSPVRGGGPRREAAGWRGSATNASPAANPLHQPAAGPPPRAGEVLSKVSPDDIAARLAGSPEQRAATIGALAQAGVADAQALLGQLLLDGNGIAQDVPAALDWFTRAAAQHHVMAINMVGRCYDLGWGTAPDKARAAACYRIAAERGLDWGMYNYATLLALGAGVAEDKPAALGWFRKAAALGNAKAINFVGSFHEDGWVVARDVNAAAYCYARAAQGGDFRGAFNHARMLGAAGKIEDAIHWLRRAGETATPAFVAKASVWLATADLPAFRQRGVQALRQGAGQC